MPKSMQACYSGSIKEGMNSFEELYLQPSAYRPQCPSEEHYVLALSITGLDICNKILPSSSDLCQQTLCSTQQANSITG